MEDRIGQRLGNYRLVRLLGKGGFAEVYLGEHVRLGTYAAVKVLYTRLASAEEVAGFQKEAQTIAHLEHPHIVRVFDFDVVNDTPFLVMSYAAGGTLRQRHRKGIALPLPTIISYVKQVADALQYAHDQRLIHRDIKPENMLVGGRDEVLLSDFGIATVAQSSRYQGAQDMAGTIAYMAPEQIQAHPRPASDQYSLGIVVYEWLSGDRPFHGAFTEIAIKHSVVPPPSLREKMPTISPEVEQVVMTALAKDPKQRFGNVRAFANALEQAYRSGEERSSVPTLLVTTPKPAIQPTRETPPSSSIPTRQASPDKVVEPSAPVVSSSESIPMPTIPVSDTVSAQLAPASLSTTEFPSSLHTSPDVPSISSSTQPVVPSKRGISRRTVLIGIAGLAVAGGGITWWVLTPHLGTTLYIYRGHSGSVNAVAWSPDGSRIAAGSTDGTVQVWDGTNGGNVYTYQGHTSPVRAVAWSPDGKRIASGSLDKTVQVWDAANGGNVYTYRGHSNSVPAVAWSPDGRHIASGGDDRTVQVWDAANGGNVYTYRGHSDIVDTVGWSPDGRRIASGSYDKTVQVWDAANGGNVYTYRGHSDVVLAVAWSPDGRRIASGSWDETVQVWQAG